MNNITSKALIFDMDGTIADLYGVEGWLEMLRAEDATPYKVAKPMYDMDTLNVILDIFHKMGYRIVVVSWGAMDATREYNKAVKRAKLDWLNSHGFPYDEVHVVKYGTPKQNFIKDNLSILIDDNDEVRASFLKSTRGQERQVIDAKQNIVRELVNMLVAAA